MPEGGEPQEFKPKRKGEKDDEHPEHCFTETKQIGGQSGEALIAIQTGLTGPDNQPVPCRSWWRGERHRSTATDTQRRGDQHARASLFDDLLFDGQTMGEQDERRKDGDIRRG